MEFLNPNMLWGLVGLAIPIAIHLLQLKRYRTVLFSDIRFLRQVQQSARKQQRIRHWLILAARLLAWSALTIAFAIPFLSSDKQGFKSSGKIIIYADNSPSMLRKGADGPLWAEARQAATDIVRRYPDASFHVITSEADGSDALEVNATGALRILNRMEPTEQSLSWDELANRISTYNLRDTAILFVLSDGQQSEVADLRKNDLPVIWFPYLFEAVESTSNVAVDSVRITSPVLLPGQTVELGYTLSVFGEEIDEVPVELWINGELRGAKTELFNENTTTEGSFSFSAPGESPVKVEVRIEDQTVHFDDNYPLALTLREGLSFLHIRDRSSASVPVDSIVTDTSASVKTAFFENIPYTQLQDFDLIVVDKTRQWPDGLAPSLRRAALEGASVLVFPDGPAPGDLEALGIAGFGITDTANFKDIRIADQEPFFHGVFFESPKRVQLPELKQYHPIAPEYRQLGGSPLLFRSNGDPSLLCYSSGQGKIYQWNAHWSNHVGWSELYPVLLYQMAIYKSSPQWNSFTLGESAEISVSADLSGSDEVVRIVQDSTTVIPRQHAYGNRIELSTAVPGIRSGFAEVHSAGEILALLAYHASREESDLTSLDAGSVGNILESAEAEYRITEAYDLDDFSASMQQFDGPESLSPWWIICALIVLLLEMILWRRPKT